jgi:8-oxo-dGTP diphosphatase
MNIYGQEYVLGFMFSKEKDRVVLMTKTKPAWQAGKLNGLGGKIEPNENILDAMVREFKEETGVLQEEWILGPVISRFGEFRVFIYKCYSDKIDDVKTMEVEEVGVYPVTENMQASTIQPQIENLSWIIPMLLDEAIDYNINFR